MNLTAISFCIGLHIKKHYHIAFISELRCSAKIKKSCGLHSAKSGNEYELTNHINTSINSYALVRFIRTSAFFVLKRKKCFNFGKNDRI